MRTVALLRLPGQKIIAFSGNAAEAESVPGHQQVFYYVPFPGTGSLSHQLKHHLSVEDALLLAEDFETGLQSTPVAATSREAYNIAAQRVLDALKNDVLKKMVLSRVIHHPAPSGFSATQLFMALCETYPDAAVHLFAEEGKAIWIGSSPELLIRCKNQVLETVSLAGTQAVNGRQENQIIWGEKEREEQQWVTTHIDSLLNEHDGILSAENSSVNTAIAGNVAHLKTTFSAKLGSDFNWKNFLDALHPTPAIGGWPKSPAVEMIQQTESHSRIYYGGYFGVDSPAETTFYLNLRCLRFSQNILQLFAGGGYTAQSDIAAEWEETGHKAQTLLSVVENLQKFESQ